MGGVRQSPQIIYVPSTLPPTLPPTTPPSKTTLEYNGVPTIKGRLLEDKNKNYDNSVIFYSGRDLTGIQKIIAFDYIIITKNNIRSILNINFYPQSFVFGQNMIIIIKVQNGLSFHWRSFNRYDMFFNLINFYNDSVDFHIVLIFNPPKNKELTTGSILPNYKDYTVTESGTLRFRYGSEFFETFADTSDNTNFYLLILVIILLIIYINSERIKKLF